MKKNNPWPEIEKTLEKANRQCLESKKDWTKDRCPICFERPILASKDPLNVRRCEQGHIWRRGQDGGYIILEGEPNSRKNEYCIIYPNLQPQDRFHRNVV